MLSKLAKRAAAGIGLAGFALLATAGISNAATLSPVTNAVSAPVSSVGHAHGRDQVPSLNLDAERFNCGGAALGYGAASLASSAYLGVGTSVIDAGKYIAEPGSIHFVNEPSDSPAGLLVCK